MLIARVKLRPLPRRFSLFAMLVYPARMAVSGRVLCVQRDIHAFTMIVQQHTTQTPFGRLKVRALMGFTTELPFSAAPLRNRNVSLTGCVAAFEDGVVVITVDSFTHLPSAAHSRAVLGNDF